MADTDPDAETIRAVMSSLGKRTSERKKASGKINVQKATEASLTPEALENRKRAARDRWARQKAVASPSESE